MNIVQLQDMLKFVPDDKLKEELSNPSGTTPQYLVLSEVVRRDKMRGASAQKPATTVLQDILGGRQQQQPTPEPQAFASGGFISPSESMGSAGFAGYPHPPSKTSSPFGSFSGVPSMFAPNANPAPPPAAPPQTTNNNNVSIAQNGDGKGLNISTPQPRPDDGQSNDFNSPSYYEQGAYANGGLTSLATGGQAGDLPFFIKREADRLGIDPVDLATAISYETKGTFDPAIKGPTTKWGRHIGLIQMGEPQRKQYGYDPEGSLDSQMSAVGRYLADRGVKPGMGLLDVYSTINAGAPGLYNRSDTKAGGAPGTVLDKVRDQMAGHKEKAMNILQGIGNLWYGQPMGAGQGAAGFEARAEGLPSPSMATRTGGIAQMVGLKPGTPGADRRLDDMKSLGAQLMQPQQIQAPDPVPMAEGNVQGLARLYTDPAQMARGMTDYSQYIGQMASGGTVRMADGTPRPAAEVQKEWADTPWYKSPFIAADDLARLMASGIGGDQLSAYLNSFVGPETYDQELASEKAKTEEARIRAGSAGAVAPYLLPAKGLTTVGKGVAGIGSAIMSNPAIRKMAIPALTAIGAGYALSPTDQPEQAGSVPMTETGPRGPESTWKPTKEEAMKEIFKRQSQPDQTSPLDKLLEYYKSRDEQMRQLYQQQIDEERKRMEESGGMGAFLRRMGIGMLTDNSSLASSLRAGAAAATSGGEEGRQQALDRIRELQLKQQMAGIEGGGEAARLAYEAATAGNVGVDDLIKLRGQYVQQQTDRAKALADASASAEEIAADPVMKGLDAQIQAINARLGVGLGSGTMSGGAASYVYDPATGGYSPK
jgi:hypothetical protein